jgi:hypothetical protein
MRARTPKALRAVLVAASFVGAGLLAGGCASPYSAPAETLAMPKKKPPKVNPDAGKVPVYGGLTEPDTCNTNFNGKDQPLVKKPAQNKAASISQDAMNAMAGAENAVGAQRRGQVQEALTILTDALRVDPYSPSATLAMAHAYALVGKKQCSKAMLKRLADLGGFPELTADVGKLKAEAKVDAVYEPFRKEADTALGN